jgi:hypothetical protein
MLLSSGSWQASLKSTGLLDRGQELQGMLPPCLLFMEETAIMVNPLLPSIALWSRESQSADRRRCAHHR